MRSCVAALLWLTLAAPVFGQGPLTVTAALDEAVSRNAELLELRRGSGRDLVESLRRASTALAEVRRAYAELAIARDALQLHEGQAPMMKEMADTAALRSGAGEMARHDPAAMMAEIARLALARSTAREQVKVAELRLNAVLGRRLDAVVEALAMREAASTPAEPLQVALARDPRLARMAGVDGREAAEFAVRRRVLEAQARVEGARERVAIMTTAVLPQLGTAFDTARAAYTANQGGFLEMLDAHHRQLQARVEHAALSAAHERALVELDIAIGETPERLLLAVGSGREN